jgi:hypothetical protein
MMNGKNVKGRSGVLFEDTTTACPKGLRKTTKICQTSQSMGSNTGEPTNTA